MVEKYNNPDWNPDEGVVWEYANRCPLTYGTIVYAIRNLYNAMIGGIHDFENNCENTEARGINKPKFIRLKQPKQIPIVQQTEKKTLLIYPNPASGMITLKYPSIKKVILYDIYGRTIKYFNYTKINMAQLNIADLQKGIYLVKIISSNNIVETQKLIVQ